MINRRMMLKGAGLAAGLALMPKMASATNGLTLEEVLFDQAIPVLGNKDGDVTVAEFFDYQCPYCKRGHKELLDVVKADGKVRMVMKDWPIFGGASLYASNLILAAGADYEKALNALMATPARLKNKDVDAALLSVGLDPAALAHAAKLDAPRIEGIISRNMDQANIFGFRGTPAFIIGTSVHYGAMDAATLRSAIADARRGA